MKKRTCLLLLAVLAAFVFTGCKGKDDIYEPVVSGLYVREDGSVVSADVEDFGKSYYDKAELQKFVEEEVIAYNDAAVSQPYAYAAEDVDEEEMLPVSILSLSAESGKASLLLNFVKASDYLDFNKDTNAMVTQMSQCTSKEAVENGLSFDNMKDKDGNAAGADQAKKRKKNFYLTVTVSDKLAEGLPIQVQGTIQFVSKNVEVTGTNEVKVPAGESAVIIYK
ncbi:MAG: hypothetical protein HFI93_04175 [Lachnospiraceae bacterium]|nr:hypothetical protein [Lachnospiraceae bacterium]